MNNLAQKFRKKPVVIEAVLVADVLKHWANEREQLPAWLTEAAAKGIVRVFAGRVVIETLEGLMEAPLGDWIIQGVAGEVYPCKPHIFAATYEAIEDQEGGPNDN